MRQFGTALAYHIPQHSHIYDHILGGKVVSAHSPWFQTEPLGPPWRLCVLVRRLFDRLIDRDSSEGVGGAKLN